MHGRMSTMRAGRFRKRVVRPALAILAVASAFVLSRLWVDNFAEVAPGRVYRSAQMPASHLSRAVRDHGIRTVLNLRGANLDQKWYPAERSATLASGATQVDVAMASDMWLSRAQARTLIQLLDTCDYPILIHCQWGAERTGLVAAITELLRPGGSLRGARRQFSPYYLYVKAGDGAVMEEHLDRYASWLQSHGLAHSPDHF